jgi:hypothetical protein
VDAVEESLSWKQEPTMVRHEAEEALGTIETMNPSYKSINKTTIVQFCFAWYGDCGKNGRYHLISVQNRNTTASQHMYVHLSNRASDQFVIVVAVNDTSVECWSSSRIISHNLVMSKDGRIRVEADYHVGRSTQTGAVIVTMNLQQQTICHVERAFWAVDWDIDGNESLCGVVSICLGCDDEWCFLLSLHLGSILSLSDHP